MTRGRTEKATKKEEEAFIEQVGQERSTTASSQRREGGDSMVLSGRTLKSPIRTLGDIGKERGRQGSKTGTIV